jgi:Tfp pilus assembly protein PilN
MSDDYQDPSSNTQAFRAFAQRNEPAEPARSRLPLIIGGAVAVLVIVLVVVLLLVG